MYNTLKGPTKQNRVIRTPNIIKLTESGVVCIAYSYCHSILPSKRHSLTLWMLGYSHFTLPSHIFHSISVDRLSASLRNSPFTSLSLSLSVHPSISQICGSLPFAHMCNTKACTFSLTIKRPDIFLRTNVLFSQAQYTSANTHTKILNSNGKENFPSNFAHSRAFRSTLFQSLDIIHPYIRKAFTLCLSTNFVCLPLFSPIIWQNST